MIYKPTKLNFIDVGPCICDMTHGICDANCCCDSDCSENDLTWFTGCISNPATNSIIPFCSNMLTKIHWWPLVGSSPTYYTTSGGALCVVISNSAVYGYFYGNPGTFTSDTTFLPQFINKAYPQSMSSYAVDSTYLLSSKYRVRQQDSCLKKNSWFN